MANNNETKTYDAKALQAMIEKLQAENEVLKAKTKSRGDTTDLGDGLCAKVSEKGAVSIYGLGRFPVTLYGEQFPRLLAVGPAILKFIVDNQGKLSTKEQAKARKAAEKQSAA